MVKNMEDYGRVFTYQHRYPWRDIDSWRRRICRHVWGSIPWRKLRVRFGQCVVPARICGHTRCFSGKSRADQGFHEFDRMTVLHAVDFVLCMPEFVGQNGTQIRARQLPNRDADLMDAGRIGAADVRTELIRGADQNLRHLQCDGRVMTLGEFQCMRRFPR